MITLVSYPLSGELTARWILERACDLTCANYPDEGQIVFYNGLPFSGFRAQKVVYLVRCGADIMRHKQREIQYHKRRDKTRKWYDTWNSALECVSDWEEHVLAWYDLADQVIHHHDMFRDNYKVLLDALGVEIKYPDLLPDHIKTIPIHIANIPPEYNKSEINYEFEIGRGRESISARAKFFTLYREGLRKAGYID